jgi:UDP-glucuronate 4-epimerase
VNLHRKKFDRTILIMVKGKASASVSEIEPYWSDSTSTESSDENDSDVSSQTSNEEMKCVLVTGGAGFIGSHVAEVLLSRGDRVVIVDEVNDYYDVRQKQQNLEILRSRYSNEQLQIYKGDICDVEFITSVYETTRPDYVCHLAARAGVRPSITDPFIYIHSNVEATTRLLELARTHGCKSFVFASSSSVYGGSDKSYFSETDVVDFPVSPYAATKKSCELIAHTYHHLYGLNIAGLRFFTVYGPRGRPDMAPFKFIDRVSRGIEIQQFGDGTSSRDYTYIDDIVDGVVRSIDTPLGYQVYNLGNGSPTKLTDFIGLVEKYCGKKAVIRQLPDQPGDVPRTCANISKAKELLGYAPKVNFEEGIKRTVQWYQSSRDGVTDEPETGLTRAPSALWC